MIKQIRASYFVNFKNAQYCALSTDPIPDYLENGDEVYMIDIGKNYIWDAISSDLYEDKSSGVFDAGQIAYDTTQTYPSGSVGSAISAKQNATNYVTLSGTIVTQTGADNTMYLCGELVELTFTAPATGQTAIRFSSGTTPTVATFSGVTWLNGFDPTAIEASKTYEVNILNGLGCTAWT